MLGMVFLCVCLAQGLVIPYDDEDSFRKKKKISAVWDVFLYINGFHCILILNIKLKYNKKLCNYVSPLFR